MVGNEYEEDGLDEETLKTKKLVGPVTIWIGVFPESTSATVAHDAAQDILALLKDHNISDVDIDFRESFYTREVGPLLHKPVTFEHPLVNVVSPITSALGLRISTEARPDTQGTMALYLAEGGGSDNLLGLSCRHVLIESKQANLDYVCHPSRPPKKVLLLSKRGHTDLVDSIKREIEKHALDVLGWKKLIETLEEREKGTDLIDIEKDKSGRVRTQASLDNAEKAISALVVFLDQAKQNWRKLDNRVLGHILRSPAIRLGVGEHRFTEDWGVFQVERAKLGDGFQGNKIDLGAFRLSNSDCLITFYI